MPGQQTGPSEAIAEDYNFNDSDTYFWEQYSYYDEQPTLRIADRTNKTCLYVRIDRDFFNDY